MSSLVEAFRKETKELGIRRVRLTSVLSVTLFSLFGILDYFVYPDKLYILWGLRALNAVIGTAVFIISYRKIGKSHPNILGAIDYLSLGFAISTMVFVTGGHESIYYTGLIVIIIGICYIMPWSLKEAIPLCLAIYLSFALPIIFFDKITSPYLFINSNFFLLCTIFIILVAVYDGNKFRLHEFMLRYNLAEAKNDLEKTLKQLKDTQTQLVHSEKMASLGQLVAGVAHEINNPAFSALNGAKALERYINKKKNNITDESIILEIEDINATIKNGLKQIHGIVADLRNFSKKDTTGYKPEEIHEGLDSTLHLLHHRLGDNIIIHKNYSNEIGEVECNPGQLNQVFMNVLKNSIDAIKDKGNIWIATKKDGDNIKVSIRDDGNGIKEENMNRIFEPFFTTKDVGEGVGLGMSISYSLIQNHNGTIDIKSKYGEGTEVIITVPQIQGGRI